MLKISRIGQGNHKKAWKQEIKREHNSNLLQRHEHVQYIVYRLCSRSIHQLPPTTSFHACHYAWMDCVYLCSTLHVLGTSIHHKSSWLLASIPGRSSSKRGPGIDCLRMRHLLPRKWVIRIPLYLLSKTMTSQRTEVDWRKWKVSSPCDSILIATLSLYYAC